MIKITVANQKGGVGKTTIAFNLATILSTKRNTRVLAIDNDPQGNLTSSFLKNLSDLTGNVLAAYKQNPLSPQKYSESLDFLGADINLAPVAERDFETIFNLSDALSNLSGSYDYSVIDTLPSFGNLHLAALQTADYVLIPVKLAPYALAGLKELFSTIKKVKNRLNPNLKILGILINQADGRKPILEREMEEALRETYGSLVLKNKINKRIRVEESPAFQKSITNYDPHGPSTTEFKKAVTEILRRIKNDKK